MTAYCRHRTPLDVDRIYAYLDEREATRQNLAELTRLIDLAQLAGPVTLATERDDSHSEMDQ